MTESIKIQAKEPCPAIAFDFQANTFAITGTCYPENVREFFEPIQTALGDHLSAQSGADIAFELRLTYFNSGASRVFAQIFDALEACAQAGNTVTVKWVCEEGDENMMELAEDFEDDFEAATFEVVVEG